MLGISGVLTNRHKTKGVLFLGLKLIIKPDKDDDVVI
jgi:hypothetical protein